MCVRVCVCAVDAVQAKHRPPASSIRRPAASEAMDYWPQSTGAPHSRLLNVLSHRTLSDQPSNMLAIRNTRFIGGRGGQMAIAPPPLILTCRQNFSGRQIFFPKYKILGWKSPILGREFRFTIEMLNTHDLVCRQLATSCLFSFLTHDIRRQYSTSKLHGLCLYSTPPLTICFKPRSTFPLFCYRHIPSTNVFNSQNDVFRDENNIAQYPYAV